MAGGFHGKPVDLISVFEWIGKVKSGEIRRKNCWKSKLCLPGSGLLRGNVHGKFDELPVEASAWRSLITGRFPPYADRIRLAKESGIQVMNLVKKKITISQILTRKCF